MVRARSRTPPRTPMRPEKKKTKDGKIILEPQPEESENDPLNWSTWRRDVALLSLGFYCMVGGGMTPVLAAGFNQVAATYDVAVARISLTTGLYMMGLGIGSVIMSPTAILFGKRPVYLGTSILFILASVWCALSPDFPSLIVARIVQGISVSPVECLPSATIAEIFFLHERAYRLGVYTLLLLGGKNLVPLVSAVVIQALGWRWVFWVVAFIVGFGSILLFLFVPETFWDRTPRPKHLTRPPRIRSNSEGSGGTHHLHLPHLFHRTQSRVGGVTGVLDSPVVSPGVESMGAVQPRKRHHDAHVAFNEPDHAPKEVGEKDIGEGPIPQPSTEPPKVDGTADGSAAPHHLEPISPSDWHSPPNWGVQEGMKDENPNPTPELHNLNSPFYVEKTGEVSDYFSLNKLSAPAETKAATPEDEAESTSATMPSTDKPMALNLPKKHVTLTPINATTEGKDSTQHHHLPGPLPTGISEAPIELTHTVSYTHKYRNAPAKSFLQTLAPYHGRLSRDNWFKVALRPFILFAYPSVLWSAMVYSLSVGWLIVLSESVSVIYKNRSSYNFTSLQVGLVYISPFIGGILGTVVAGKVSDYIVRFMARRNDGIYEPEFRLVMSLPVAVATTIGLMGFGWSAQERDAWIVPTFFFGVISFGCTLGSTTAITFCVDSYRQYAGEALVTLNFSKSKFPFIEPR